MIETVGHFVGRRVADVVNFFRGRQAVPCLVDWDEQPCPDVRAVQRPEFSHYDQMPDPLYDCCPDYDTDCCLPTDTIGEFGK